MNFILTKELNQTQKEEITVLWNAVYPIELRYESSKALEEFIDTKAAFEYYIFSNESGKIIGWLGVFTRDNERWFSIMVDPQYQGKKLGTQLLVKAKEKEPILNGWVVDHNNHKKVNGEPYLSPLSFYKKIGFEVFHDIHINQKNLSAVKITWNRE